MSLDHIEIDSSIQAVLYKLILSLLGQTGTTSTDPGRAAPGEFEALIQQASARYQVDPTLVKAVIQAESNYDAQAISSAGAQGLMQLMPGTAASLGVQDAFDPAQNIDGGVRFLSRLLDRYEGDARLALAAYNAGPGAVDRYGGIPPYRETQTYVQRVLSLMDSYRTWSA